MKNNKRRQGQTVAHTIALVLAAVLVASCSTSSTTISAADPAATSGTTQDSTTVDEQTPTAPVEADDPANTSDDPDPTEAADTDDTDDQTPADDARDQAPADDDTAASGPSIVLLDPGAEPRAELRLVIAASCGEIMTFRQVQEIDQVADGTPQPSSGSIGNVMEMATSAARNGDNYDVRAEVISANAAAGTPPDLAALINPALADLIGLSTFATITDRGVQVPGSARLEGGESLGPLRETVEAATQTQAPLPIEPVGVGARWKTTATIYVQGLTVVTTTESEIVAIDGTIVELSISANQHVAIGSQMNVEGITAEVTEWTSITTSEITIDLATISPISSTSVTEATQSFKFDGGPDGAAGGSLNQTIHSEVSVTGVPDDGCTGRTLRP